MERERNVEIRRENNPVKARDVQGGPGYVAPRADIYHTPDAFVLVLDMPGANKEAIHVTVDQGSLVVDAALPSRNPGDATLLYNEITGAGYHRAFNLGEGVDHDHVDARFEQGVLTLKLYKREDQKPREITIS